MLGHLRSRTLFDFKNQLEQSLKRGELFAASVHDCSHSCMLEFDKGCAGVLKISLDLTFCDSHPAIHLAASLGGFCSKT